MRLTVWRSFSRTDTTCGGLLSNRGITKLLRRWGNWWRAPRKLRMLIQLKRNGWKVKEMSAMLKVKGLVLLRHQIVPGIFTEISQVYTDESTQLGQCKDWLYEKYTHEFEDNRRTGHSSIVFLPLIRSEIWMSTARETVVFRVQGGIRWINRSQKGNNMRPWPGEEDWLQRKSASEEQSTRVSEWDSGLEG